MSNKSYVAIILAVGLILSIGCIVLVFAIEEPISAANVSFGAASNETELISFVESAVAHAKEVGKDNAIKDFMDLNGPWVKGDVYIFAHDFNGTALSLPYMPKEVGTNRSDIKNDQGAYINREMRSIALNGGGFYEYNYRNPISNQTEPKLGYVMKVDDTWWLGAGIYKT